MMSLWDALRMNMMISYQELVRTFHRNRSIFHEHNEPLAQGKQNKILLYLIYVI